MPFSTTPLFGMTIRESADDGSDFTNPSADYRRLFLGEDGQLHVKDSSGTVTAIGSSSGIAATLLDAKGDLIAASAADTAARLAVGANGTHLVAASGETTGIKWQGAWADYTPTWTTDGTAPALGNGSLTGRWMQIGPIAYFHMAFVAGTTTTYGTGNWNFALPIAAANTTRGHAYGVALDSSAGARDGVNAFYEPAGTVLLRITPDTGNAVTNTVPWTWATSDELSLSGWIECAP